MFENLIQNQQRAGILRPGYGGADGVGGQVAARHGFLGQYAIERWRTPLHLARAHQPPALRARVRNYRKN